MFELVTYLSERHRETLRNPHKPKPERRPFRWPRLLARFNYRQPKTRARPKPARQ